MHVLVVYAHPSRESFTYEAREAFLKGLTAGGHTYEVSDLYGMNFQDTFTEEEYLRDAMYDNSKPIAADIVEEQRKIEAADVIAFFYPVFWTEAPAKLVGWFQRVWTYGYAYGPEATMKQLDKALFFVTMGGSLQDEVRQREVEAMKTVMLGDRIHDRAKEKMMYIFDEMTRGYGNDGHRAENAIKFTKKCYEIGRTL